MGMKAESLGSVAERVRDERLEAAKRVVQVGRIHGAEMILLTGDLFEDNAVDRLLVRKVGEILRAFNGPIFIIPGNMIRSCRDLCGSTRYGRRRPISLCWRNPSRSIWTTASCSLVRCTKNIRTRDPTAWIDARNAGKIAIGVAHGNVEGIPNGEPD